MAGRPLTDWENGLFDCFDDPKLCCFGFWCGPCLACIVTGAFGENKWLPLIDVCFGSVIHPVGLYVRVNMREKYGIKGTLAKDIFISSCCPRCSWCQMHRELKHRIQTPDVITGQAQSAVHMQPAPLNPRGLGAVGQTGVIQASH